MNVLSLTADTALAYGVSAVVAMIVASCVGAVESAVRTVSRARVEEFVKEERSGATALLRVIEHKSVHRNLLLLAKTLLDAMAAILLAVIAINFWGLSVLLLSAVIICFTVIHFLIVGVVARTIGTRNPYSISLPVARVLVAVGTILGPVSRLLMRLGAILIPGEGAEHGPFAGEVELREMVDIAEKRGVVENTERQMIQSVFDLASTTARSVMMPRTDMVWIESTKNAGQATALCVRSGYSRLPVIGENVDDIVGIIYLKDLVQRTYSSTDSGRSVLVEEVMRPPIFLPDSKNLDDVLHEMQVGRFHLAMLVDEYGAIAGLISIEDILEEIVGEIADEYDTLEVPPIEKIGEDTYRVQAKVTLDDLKDFIDEHYTELVFDDDLVEQVDTVGGILAYRLGRVPLPGAETTEAGLHFIAEGGPDRRGRLRVRSVIMHVNREKLQEDE